MLKTCQPGMNSSHELRGRSFVEWGEFNVSLIDARVETDTQSNERVFVLGPPSPLSSGFITTTPTQRATRRRDDDEAEKNAARRHEMRAT